MMSIFQYAKTTHPDVLSVVRENAKNWDEFIEKLGPLSEKYAGSTERAYWRGNSTSGGYVAGILPTDKPLPGQWKKPDRNGLRIPYKSNPAYEDFRIGTRPAPVPGRPSLIFGNPDRNGTSWMSHGAVFEYDGVVYSGVDFEPDSSRDTVNGIKSSMDDFGWSEILSSEFYAAMKAINEKKSR